MPHVTTHFRFIFAHQGFPLRESGDRIRSRPSRACPSPEKNLLFPAAETKRIPPHGSLRCARFTRNLRVDRCTATAQDVQPAVDSNSPAKLLTSRGAKPCSQPKRGGPAAERRCQPRLMEPAHFSKMDFARFTNHAPSAVAHIFVKQPVDRRRDISCVI